MEVDIAVVNIDISFIIFVKQILKDLTLAGGFNCAFDHPKNEIRCPNLSQAQKDQCKIDLTDEFLLY